MAVNIVLLLALLPIGAHGQAGVLRCTYEVGKGAGSVSGTASVESRAGRIQRAEFALSLIVAEHGDYDVVSTCHVDVLRDGKDTRWSEARGVTRIDFLGHDVDEDYLTVSRANDGYLVDFTRTGSYLKCGASAVLPKRVRIPLAGPNCVVER